MTILIRNLGEMHSTIDSILSNYDGDGPIRVVWPRRIKKNVQNFQRLFSGHVVYAVKCNPDPTILEALKQGGIDDFDVASIGEIECIILNFFYIFNCSRINNYFISTFNKGWNLDIQSIV